jgi:hypothetical protein
MVELARANRKGASLISFAKGNEFSCAPDLGKISNRASNPGRPSSASKKRPRNSYSDSCSGQKDLQIERIQNRMVYLLYKVKTRAVEVQLSHSQILIFKSVLNLSQNSTLKLVTLVGNNVVDPHLKQFLIRFNAQFSPFFDIRTIDIEDNNEDSNENSDEDISEDTDSKENPCEGDIQQHSFREVCCNDTWDTIDKALELRHQPKSDLAFVKMGIDTGGKTLKVTVSSVQVVKSKSATRLPTSFRNGTPSNRLLRWRCFQLLVRNMSQSD